MFCKLFHRPSLGGEKALYLLFEHKYSFAVMLIILKKHKYCFGETKVLLYLCITILRLLQRNSLSLTANLQNNMQTTKEKTSQNQYLVRRVSLTDSIKSIPVGVSVTFDCREAGSMASAKSAVSRLNKAAGREEYKVTSTDNGVTSSVTPNK